MSEYLVLLFCEGIMEKMILPLQKVQSFRINSLSNSISIRWKNAHRDSKALNFSRPCSNSHAKTTVFYDLFCWAFCHDSKESCFVLQRRSDGNGCRKYPSFSL